MCSPSDFRWASRDIARLKVVVPFPYFFSPRYEQKKVFILGFTRLLGEFSKSPTAFPACVADRLELIAKILACQATEQAQLRQKLKDEEDEDSDLESDSDADSEQDLDETQDAELHPKAKEILDKLNNVKWSGGVGDDEDDDDDEDWDDCFDTG